MAGLRKLGIERLIMISGDNLSSRFSRVPMPLKQRRDSMNG